ncbi:aspartic proteinase CDR1-like [Cicer arietinum]|uniref:Aspartic proteinase CDR1-like n=1 Tax=Cicer arietinum TaxID=3827 RepID=A0A1S3EHJ1_CICAR|nr:aspartic proteinase CDR1-like [Cicer arietinum]
MNNNSNLSIYFYTRATMNSLCSFFTLVLFFLCFVVSLSDSLNDGFNVELIHRDSSKSPFYHSTQNKYQHVSNALRRSINRVNHFYKDSLIKTPKSIVTPDNGEYLMSYSIGTPPFKLYGIVDTGSDIVWLQCKPCHHCYNQTSGMFDPSKSSSYKSIPCLSKTCKYVSDTQCTKRHSCEYTIQYGDQSRSQGDLVTETLTLDSTTGRTISFPKTVIGCGTQNTVSFHGQSSGIVGLGRGHVSLTTQLGSSISGKFSYCLVPMWSESNITSKLNFGHAAVVSGHGTVSTPLSNNPKEVFYYLTLEAISVGNERIKFRDPSRGSEEGNIIIDSGTTLTLLPTEIYINLESAVAKLVKLKRARDPNNILNLCYSIPSHKYNFPTITLHFKDADVKLASIGTFIEVADGIICFAFASTESGAIFGNLAQQNLLVGYDLVKKHVSFKSTDCTKLH